MSDLKDEEQPELPYGSGLSPMTRLKLYFATVNHRWFSLQISILSLVIGLVWISFRPWIHAPAVLQVIDGLVAAWMIILWGGLGLFWLYRRNTPSAVYVPDKYRSLPIEPPGHLVLLLFAGMVILLGLDTLLEVITQGSFVEQMRQRPLSSEAVTVFETILLAGGSFFLSMACWPLPKHLDQGNANSPRSVIRALVCSGMSGVCLLASCVLVVWASASGLKAYPGHVLGAAITGLLIFVGLVLLTIVLVVNEKVKDRRSQKYGAADIFDLAASKDTKR